MSYSSDIFSCHIFLLFFLVQRYNLFLRFQAKLSKKAFSTLLYICYINFCNIHTTDFRCPSDGHSLQIVCVGGERIKPPCPMTYSIQVKQIILLPIYKQNQTYIFFIYRHFRLTAETPLLNTNDYFDAFSVYLKCFLMFFRRFFRFFIHISSRNDDRSLYQFLFHQENYLIDVRAKTTKLPHRGKSVLQQRFEIWNPQHQEPGSTGLCTVNNLIDSKLLQ